MDEIEKENKELQAMLDELDLQDASDDDEPTPSPSLFLPSEGTPAPEDTAIPTPPSHENGKLPPPSPEAIYEGTPELISNGHPPPSLNSVPSPAPRVSKTSTASSLTVERSNLDLSFSSASLGPALHELRQELQASAQDGAATAGEALQDDGIRLASVPEGGEAPAAAPQEPTLTPEPPRDMSALFGGPDPSDDYAFAHASAPYGAPQQPPSGLGEAFGGHAGAHPGSFFDFLAGDRQPAAQPQAAASYGNGHGFYSDPQQQQGYGEYADPSAGAYGQPYWDGTQWVYPPQQQQQQQQQLATPSNDSYGTSTSYASQEPSSQYGYYDSASYYGSAATSNASQAQQQQSYYSPPHDTAAAPQTSYYDPSASYGQYQVPSPLETQTSAATSSYDCYGTTTAPPPSYGQGAYPSAAFSSAPQHTQPPAASPNYFQPQSVFAPSPPASQAFTPSYSSTQQTAASPSFFIPGTASTQAQPPQADPSPSSFQQSYYSAAPYQQPQHVAPSTFSPFPPPALSFFEPGSQQPSPLQSQASWGQPQPMPSSGQALYANPPRSVMDAYTNNCGRPPCAVMAFGFGGSFAVLRPGTLPEKVEVLPFKRLLLQRLRSERESFAARSNLPFLGPGEEAPKAESDQEVLEKTPGLVQDLLLGLESFPGPLSNPVGGPKLKQLAEFLRLRASQAADPDLRTLYALLVVAVNNNGLFRAIVGQPPPKGTGQGEASEPVEQQVARALTTTAPTSALARPPTAVPENPDVVMREVQQYLTAGKKVEAAVCAVRGGLFGLGCLLATECPPLIRQDLIAHIVQHTVQPDAPLHAYLMVLAGRTQLEGHTAPADLSKLMADLLKGEGGDKDGGSKSSRGGLGISNLFGLRRGNSGLEIAKEEAGKEDPSAALSAAFPFAAPVGAAAVGGPVPIQATATAVAQTPIEDRWRELVSMLATTRPQGDLEVMRQLALRLMNRGMVAAAHCCFLLAPPCLAGAFAPEEALCLLGANHRSSPRTYCTVDALQRTEVLEWYLQLHFSPASAMAGQLQSGILALQPYRLVTAAKLAEAGHSAKALKYCEAIQSTFKIVQRLPAALLICKELTGDLERRLRVHLGAEAAAHATASYNASGGSIVGSISRLIDRSITRLVGMEEHESYNGTGPVAPSGHGTAAAAGYMDGYATPTASTGAPPSPQPSPLPPLSPEPRSRRSELGDEQETLSARSPLAGGTPKQKSEDPRARQKSEQRKRQGSIGSIFTGITGLLGVNRGSGKEIKLGQENRFYFDEKLGCWREEGSDEVPNIGPPPPPPTTGLGWAPSTANAAGGPPTGAGLGGVPSLGGMPPSAGASLGGPPGGDGAVGKPPIPPGVGPGVRRDVRSRYVDSGIKTGAAPSTSSVGLGLRPPGAGLLPAAPGMMMMPPAPTAPAAPPTNQGGGGGGGSAGFQFFVPTPSPEDAPQIAAPMFMMPGQIAATQQPQQPPRTSMGGSETGVARPSLTGGGLGAFDPSLFPSGDEGPGLAQPQAQDGGHPPQGNGPMTGSVFDQQAGNDPGPLTDVGFF